MQFIQFARGILYFQQSALTILNMKTEKLSFSGSFYGNLVLLKKVIGRRRKETEREGEGGG